MPFIEPVPLPHGGPSDITLWRIDFPFDASLDDSPAFACLSDDERVRAGRFLRHEDAVRFGGTRAALRELLARHLEVTAQAVRFAKDANGRPQLAQSAAFDFNVSHTGAHGLIAISPLRRVGVDIEQHRVGFDWRSIAPLTLDPAEVTWLERRDAVEQSSAFYDAWVAKEALVKTTGAGIARGLQHLAVLPREDAQVVLRNGIPDDMRDIAAQWIAAPQGYSACVAWSMTPFSHRR
ncbi:4'-phosphopantetheinyl transferase superfamily protein [Paraburkholderia sp. D15]|uniref:4'-phosphopantetheinyl transferase family protein n=1 Tax=Paraburkholderia sp. D15 TaxID=2880218 RepID=UPI00247AE940|nr:4'-phosphopantetheinyl transferase superfamily protein [Paraburkholderia sp. D15]WGS52176.1 4'-phosphopantetheinyl transferase superfamily protein [Paraburkholderia sp. D15]WKF59542.1 4'-phosphopantetheinyl transferase Sfp [Paraburkholderia busanensis]